MSTPLGREERDRLRLRLERERARLRSRLEEAAREADDFRGRVGTRDPCAYLSPATAREDAEQLARLRHAHGGDADLREVEAAIQLLEEDPAAFGICGRCGAPITLARLEIVPQTRLCGPCAREIGAD